MRIRYRLLAIIFAAGVVFTSPALRYFAFRSSGPPDWLKGQSTRISRGRSRTAGHAVPYLPASQVGIIAPPPGAKLGSPRPFWFNGGSLLSWRLSPCLAVRRLPCRIPLRC
ncbi:MAG: hypothetical protein ACLQIB_32880 [Isosphaeraceae bacterium]